MYVCTQGCVTARAGSWFTLGKRLMGNSLQDSSLGNPNCPSMLTTLPSPTLFTCPFSWNSFSFLFAQGSWSPLRAWDFCLPLALGPCLLGQAFFSIFLILSGL